MGYGEIFLTNVMSARTINLSLSIGSDGKTFHFNKNCDLDHFRDSDDLSGDFDLFNPWIFSQVLVEEESLDRGTRGRGG